jgi:threonine synthase
MQFISTRGAGPCDFKTAVMSGLAEDGGLYVPEHVPDLSGRLAAWQGQPFPQVFQEVIAPFVGPAIDEAALRAMVLRGCARFTHPEVTPVVPVGPLYLCELFHGPTLAFKDVALQFLGLLFERFLEESQGRLTIVGATSGDTGSAAIHALRGRKGIEVFILFPQGRVSPTQELQMTTVEDANIHAIAVQGSFDDAQDIVKGLFNDRAFNARFSLGAVNSINWARVMAQITYFFYAYLRVVALRREAGMRVGDPIQVSVPTGNFGHVYAAILARRMGLPVSRLIVATNANAILHRFLERGEYRKGTVVQTLSPSMDIQVASNFERYLFDLAGRDGRQVTAWLEALRGAGGFRLDGAPWERARRELRSAAVDDEATLATIAEVHRRWGYLLDPHSAVGVRAALDLPAPGEPTLCMATAHPAKFSAAIARAVGFDPPLPPALAGLDQLPTRVQVLPARLDSVQTYINATIRAIVDL